MKKRPSRLQEIDVPVGRVTLEGPVIAWEI